MPGPRIPKRKQPLPHILPSGQPSSRSCQHFIVPFKAASASLPLKLQRNQRLVLTPYRTMLPSTCHGPHATSHRTHPCLPAIGQVLVPALPPTLLYQLHFFCCRHVHISSFPQASKPHEPSFLHILSLASKFSFDLHSQASGLCSLTSNLYLNPLQPGFPSGELTTVKVWVPPSVPGPHTKPST